MTYQEFRKKYLGTKVDWDKKYGGQCVDLFRQYVNDVLELKQPKGVVGAKDFWANYEKDAILKDNFVLIENTPKAVPQEGDVMIWDAWKGNEFGHIAIFDNGDVNKFTSLDQNYPTLNKVTLTEHSYTNPKVLGWLRPKSMVKKDQYELFYTELLIKYSELRKRWDERDKEFDQLKAENKTLKRENEELKTELNTRLTEFEQAVKDLRANNAEWKKKCEDLADLNIKLMEETKLWNAIKNAVLSLFKK